MPTCCLRSHGMKISRQKQLRPFSRAAVKGPDALMEVYTCHEKAISSLILESPPTQITMTDWVQAQKADPTINQVITLLEDKKLDTVKVGKEMSQVLKQCLNFKFHYFVIALSSP